MGMKGWPFVDGTWKPLLNRLSILNTFSKHLFGYRPLLLAWKMAGPEAGLQMLLSTSNHRITWWCREKNFYPVYCRSQNSSQAAAPSLHSPSLISKTYFWGLKFGCFKVLFVGLEGVGEVWGLMDYFEGFFIFYFSFLVHFPLSGCN